MNPAAAPRSVLIDGSVWLVPASMIPGNVGICRGCGAAIDCDGTSHFATCPQADTFRRPRP